MEGLAKLKPAFAADGKSTAGNSSQGALLLHPLPMSVSLSVALSFYHA
jgi:hypothetical protein